MPLKRSMKLFPVLLAGVLAAGLTACGAGSAPREAGAPPAGTNAESSVFSGYTHAVNKAGEVQKIVTGHAKKLRKRIRQAESQTPDNGGG